jgi:uncharacterized membrane protein YqaE (UPF0057 family)
MAGAPEDKYLDRLTKKNQDKSDKRKRLLSGTGPIGQGMVYFIEKILIDQIFKGIYNQFIDILEQSFTYVQNTFFSDFKGFLAGKLKQKRGACFEYTFFRYFMTLMLPPMGIFLARGISGWYNILLCGLLCFVKYFPGLIYALIVIQNAPYSKRYQDMKRKKLEKSKAQYQTDKSGIEVSYTPLIFFVLAMIITIIVVYISMLSNPYQSVIGDPLNMIANTYNNHFGGTNIKGVIHSELKDQAISDLKTKAISKFM